MLFRSRLANLSREVEAGARETGIAGVQALVERIDAEYRRTSALLQDAAMQDAA